MVTDLPNSNAQSSSAWRIVNIGGAFLVSAVVPAICFAAIGSSLKILPIAFMVTLLHSVLLGLPVFLVLRMKGWVNVLSSISGGFGIGCLPAGIYFWPPRSGSGSAWIGPENTAVLIDGIPTMAGWISYLELVASVGGLGALGGLGFWCSVKVPELLVAVGNPKHGVSSTPRRASLTPYARYLPVPVLAIVLAAGILSIPAVTKDRSCHNMLRDGRSGIGPVVNAKLQVPDDQWPAIIGFFEEFAARNRFSFRANGAPGDSDTGWLYLSACNETGVNITMFERYWWPDGDRENPKRHGVAVNVYEVTKGAGWRLVARDLIAEIGERWPGNMEFRDNRGRVMPIPEDLAPD